MSEQTAGDGQVLNRYWFSRIGNGEFEWRVYVDAATEEEARDMVGGNDHTVYIDITAAHHIERDELDGAVRMDDDWKRRTYLSAREKRPIFLDLYHGRPDPEQDMEDWGSEGPVFGPYNFIAQAYGGFLRCVKANGEEDWFPFFNNELIYYDGVFYGDWSVSAAVHADVTPIYAEQGKLEVPDGYERAPMPVMQLWVAHNLDEDGETLFAVARTAQDAYDSWVESDAGHCEVVGLTPDKFEPMGDGWRWAPFMVD